MTADSNISELRTEIAGLHGLLSRVAAALHLDTHPHGVLPGLVEYCQNSERARRTANAQTTKIEFLDEGKTAP